MFAFEEAFMYFLADLNVNFVAVNQIMSFILCCSVVQAWLHCSTPGAS